MTPQYQAASNATDHIIAQLEGLVIALDGIVREFDGTNNDAPVPCAITALTDVIREKVSEVITSRTREWYAAKA